jgi:F-type H+-transporting ATPase subunit delta
VCERIRRPCGKPYSPRVTAAGSHTPYALQKESCYVATDEQKTASMPGRYALALFELAKDQNQLAEVEQALTDFTALLDESPDLKRLVKSPVFSADEQIKALTGVLDAAGIGGLAGNFLKVIAKNRRLFAAPEMVSIFRDLTASDRGEVKAEVTSAAALDESQVEAIRDRIKQSVGRDVQLHTRVDPSLLGGLIVKVGSRMIDSSLRTKLTMLKTRMKEVG